MKSVSMGLDTTLFSSQVHRRWDLRKRCSVICCGRERPWPPH